MLTSAVCAEQVVTPGSGMFPRDMATSTRASEMVQQRAPTGSNGGIYWDDATNDSAFFILLQMADYNRLSVQP